MALSQFTLEGAARWGALARGAGRTARAYAFFAELARRHERRAFSCFKTHCKAWNRIRNDKRARIGRSDWGTSTARSRLRVVISHNAVSAQLPDDCPGSHSTLRLTRANKPNGYLLGTYRIATAPEANSSRLTSLKSTRFDSPANNVGPWPASLGCTMNSYSSINPSSANATGSFTPAETLPPSFRKSPGQRGGHRPGRGSRRRDDASLRPRILHDDRSTRPM